MDQPNLNVHSITVSHTIAPDGKGSFAPVKQLTYKVGDHGPFVHTYTPPDGDANKMKSDIQAQVAELTDLHSVTG